MFQYVTYEIKGNTIEINYIFWGGAVETFSKSHFCMSNRTASPTPAGVEIIYLALLTSRQVPHLMNGLIKHLLITT